jgi:two-component system sensor histidine kinase MprB
VSASHELHAQTDHFLLQRSQDRRILSGLQGTPEFPPGGPRDDVGRFAEPDAYVQLVAADGSVNTPSIVALPVDARDRAIAKHDQPAHFRTTTIGGTPYRILTVPVDGGAAQIARSITETDNVLSTLDVRLLLIALAGTAVAGLLAWIIARRIVRPVERLTRATEDVARTQDLASTIDIDRSDELGRLAASFNTMLVALRTSRDQQQRLVMDASHELRTPLTALRTNVDVLHRNTAMTDAQRAQLLSEVRVELADLTDLVAELVDLATDARAEEPPQPTDLAVLADRVVERARRRAGRTVRLTCRDAATLDVRASAVERALSNLVDNAAKFSNDDTPIDVSVDGAVIEVRDHGIGIDPGDRAHVFERFYRAPAARSMPGSGLGLSIVKQIADMHGGTIELVPRDGGGTIARLSLAA